MKIKSINSELDGIKINSECIRLVSADESFIVLPYVGYIGENVTKAAVSVMFQVGLTVNIMLHVEQNGITQEHPISATDKEIFDLMWPFFFTGKGNTRIDTGLADYQLGLWQAHFINWYALTRSKER